LIEPLKRTGLAVAANQNLDGEFLRVHAERITLARRNGFCGLGLAGHGGEIRF
jgi:hypothetical protein